jgi:hypothetical protein
MYCVLCAEHCLLLTVYLIATGDVDILILPPEGEESCLEVLQPLLDVLKAQYFLTDDLTLK